MEEIELYCYTCSIGFSSLVFLKEHTLSLMHHKVLDHQQKNKGSKHPEHHCFICNKSMHLNSWNGHIESSKHKHHLELMKASIAHSGTWNDPPQSRPSAARPPSRPQSRAKSLPSSHRNSRSGSSERYEHFKAAAWNWSRPPADAQPPPPPPPQPQPQPPPPRRNDLRLPPRAFSSADSDESERRRQQDRAETEELLRKAQAMQEAFRRERERQASHERQHSLHPGMEGPIVVGRASREDVNVRPSSAVQQNGRGLKFFQRPSSPDKDKSRPTERSRSPPAAPIRGTLDLSKNNHSEFGENGTSVSKLKSVSRTTSAMGSVSSASLPVRASPVSSIVVNSRPTSAQGVFKAPNPAPAQDPFKNPSRALASDLHKNPGLDSRSSSAEIMSKLGIASNPAPPPPREVATATDRRAAASCSALLNVINSPRSRKERRQLAELLRTLPHPSGPARRPRLNPALSPSMMRSISQHEEGAAKLPLLDLSVEEATSGVTSLSTTAREEEEESSERMSEETERSGTSLVSPLAKKRKTGQMEVDEEDEGDDSLQSEEPLSEEVSRMQLALQLSVQQQTVHRKVELLNTDLSEQYRQLEALQRKIEGMEIELNKLRAEETDIHQQRMDVLKKSYLKPFGTKSSEASVTSASECSSSHVESTLSTSAVEHSVTSSDSQTDTVIAARPLNLKQEVDHFNTTDDLTEEDSEEPLIGNLTAREIRERAMAMIGGGAMNFADLDDVIGELMDKVSSDLTEDLDPILPSHPEPQPQEVKKGAKRRRRHSKGQDEQESSSEHRTEPESVVSDVMSARPRGGSKKDSDRSGRRSANSSQSEESSSSGAPPPHVVTFAGAIEAHNGPVNDLQLFRNCLYSCAEDASVKKFSPQSHECIKQFSGFSDSVRCLLVTEKSKGMARIFSGGDEKILLVHDARTGKELQRLPLDAQISCMQLHWSSIFIGLSSGTLVELDVRKNNVLRTKRISDHPVRFLHIARREPRSVIIVATSNGTLWLLDVNMKSDPQQILPPSRGGERPIQMHAVRDRLLFVTDAGRLRQLPLFGAQSPGVAEDVEAEFGAKVCCLHVPGHGQHLLVGCRDGSIRLMERSDFTQVTKVYYTPGRSALTALTANLNGNTGSIFAGNKNGQLLVIHVSNTSIACQFGDCKLTFGSRDDLVYHVTREHVMSASESDVPCLWAKTCKHHFDRTRSEDISIHVRLHT